MSISLFIHLHGDASKVADVCRLAERSLEGVAHRLGDRGTVLLHSPLVVPGADPLPVEQDARLALCQVCLDDPEALTGGDITPGLSVLSGLDGVREVQSHVMSREWLKAGSPDDRTAPAQAVSFFVQYDGPAEDPAEFHTYYRNHHVPIVFRMPGIRSVTYYLPKPFKAPAIGHPVERLQIVQAVFDSAGDFVKMRQSSQRKEGLRDFENYPKFEGPVTHQVMHSKRLV